MITGLKPKALLYRDGTSQSQRRMDALDPAYACIDERSVEDLLGFAQQYANELIFFDENNNPVGTWEAFLLNEAGTENLSDDEKVINRRKWISEIMLYIESPEKFSSDQEKLRKFSRPHLALFISFLQLLGHVKDQLNTLTKKHLDFFYVELLGLSKKKPVPDVVNVIVELAKDVNELLIEKGTALYAGKDSLGKELIYTTEKDTVINRASIENIKTLFVEKRVITFSEARINNVKTKEEGFTKMFELALGNPKNADDLPLYKSEKIDYGKLLSFYNQLISNTAPATVIDYIKKSLFLKEDDFRKIIATCSNMNASSGDWSVVDDLLEKAYHEKVKWNRQEVLRKVREEDGDAEKGFYEMYEFALGDPNPYDKLPIYKAAAASLEVIYADLNAGEPLKKEAADYVREELFLSESDFKNSVEVYKKKKPFNEEWEKVYANLELAQRKKRNYQLPSPIIEEWINVYSIKDAKASAFRIYEGEEESSLRFNTFGKGRRPEEWTNVEAAKIGFAVSSPQLELKEGNRTITITVFFKKDIAINAEEIGGILSVTDTLYQPFLFYVSSEKEWIETKPVKVQFGNLIVTESTDIYTAQVNNGELIKTGGNNFIAKKDEGKFIVFDDGTIYAVLAVKSAVALTVKNVGKVDKHTGTKKYNAEDIVFNVCRAELQLKENDEPVVAPLIANDVIGIKSSFPVVAMLLNQVPLPLNEQQDDDVIEQEFQSLYQQFKNLQVETVKVDVSVTGIKALALQNDTSVLNYKKPFEPFGFRPQVGSSLYFSNSELSQKQLQTLSMKFEWMNPPTNFTKYYANYWKLKTGQPGLDDTNTVPAEYEIKSNSSFTATVKLIDNNVTLALQSVDLFNKDNAKNEHTAQVNLADQIAQVNAAFTYNRINIADAEDDVIDWERYFVLELNGLDFQPDTYPALLTRQALINPDPKTQTADEKALRSLQVNQPYTPKIKSLTLGYTASFSVNFNNVRTKKDDVAYHINAFGYKQLNGPDAVDAHTAYFLPYYKSEGELYIGVDKLTVPQNLSLLFQMAEGSADPDLEPQTITWSYLSNNEWLQLKGDNILSDSTNGLLNTGILEFYIPGDATNNNTVLSEKLYWLRATISTNNGAISDTVDIYTQGISAAFTNNDNAADHLLNLLPPGSIKETVVKKTEIKKITQPYTSSKGKPGEVDSVFYNRVSERLRHKNRALTMWDYERIILEQFPSIYKVKCFPAQLSANATKAGGVDVVVIPDIRGKLPFNPFQPKVPPETIREIQQYLEQRMPAFATLRVKNPSYLQVKVRFAVKIKRAYNEAFFTRKLEEELRRYLAPWAYDEGADITIGGKIYANVIVNFLAEKPYVDYVAGIKLFQSEDGKVFRDVRTINKGENVVYATQPDVILVSALNHEIDKILEEGFEEQNFTGINYMKIGLDFEVG